jgi:ABC-type glutathione transport system ATPase component
MRVGAIIAEPPQIHTDLTHDQQHDRVGEVLDLVGLDPEAAQLSPPRFPAAIASRSPLRVRSATPRGCRARYAASPAICTEHGHNSLGIGTSLA